LSDEKGSGAVRDSPAGTMPGNKRLFKGETSRGGGYREGKSKNRKMRAPWESAALNPRGYSFQFNGSVEVESLKKNTKKKLETGAKKGRD